MTSFEDANGAFGVIFYPNCTLMMHICTIQGHQFGSNSPPKRKNVQSDMRIVHFTYPTEANCGSRNINPENRVNFYKNLEFNNSADRLTRMHQFKAFVDLIKR